MTKYYKGFNKNMQCRNFQYEEGKEYEFDGDPKLCSCGYHACEAPLDVLRYYPINNDNVYRVVECDGVADETGDDSKCACKKIRIGADIGLEGLINEHFKYIQENFETKRVEHYSAGAGGDKSILAGGSSCNLAGGYNSNLFGSIYSVLAGGFRSNLIGGDRCNLVGSDNSNLIGGDRCNIAGADGSNIVSGHSSNLVGGHGSRLISKDRCTLVGGHGSALAGGRHSIIVARDDSRAKAGLGSIIVLTKWGYINNEYVPITIKAELVDGKRIKADTWYKLDYDGEFVELPTETLVHY